MQIYLFHIPPYPQILMPYITPKNINANVFVPYNIPSNINGIYQNALDPWGLSAHLYDQTDHTLLNCFFWYLFPLWWRWWWLHPQLTQGDLLHTVWWWVRGTLWLCGVRLWDTVLWNFHSALVAFLPKSGGCGTLAADLPNHNVFWSCAQAAAARYQYHTRVRGKFCGVWYHKRPSSSVTHIQVSTDLMLGSWLGPTTRSKTKTLSIKKYRKRQDQTRHG